MEREYDFESLHISKVKNKGSKIILSDKSKWWVYLFDSVKSFTWQPKDEVILREMKDMDSWEVLTNTIYPYTTIIKHIASGKMVGAKRAND